MKWTGRVLAGLLMAGLIGNSWAFDYAREIDKAQERFGKVKDYPIVIFNQDEISWQLAQSNAYEDTPKAKVKRIQIIQEYVKTKSGLEISDKEAESLENYITVQKDSAFAMPILEGSWGERSFKMCAVFPASPNSNQRLEHERMLGLLTDEVYGDLGYEDVNLRMPYEQLAMFSIYHEISHCLDSEFMPSNYNGQENPHNVHLSESFAEALALLLLEQMGYENMGRARGQMRMMYSRMMGGYFARNPGLGMGNPFFVKGGVIYHLDPALRGAQEFAFYAGNDFENMVLEELIHETVNIVQKYALDSRTFYAIGNYLEAEDKQEAIQTYRERAFDSPELFYKAYTGLIEYHDYTSYVLEQLMGDVSIRESYSKDLGNSLLKGSELCQAFKERNRNIFDQEVERFRLILREEELPAESQRHMAKELNSLHEDLLTQCR